MLPTREGQGQEKTLAPRGGVRAGGGDSRCLEAAASGIANRQERQIPQLRSARKLSRRRSGIPRPHPWDGNGSGGRRCPRPWRRSYGPALSRPSIRRSATVVRRLKTCGGVGVARLREAWRRDFRGRGDLTERLPKIRENADARSAESAPGRSRSRCLRRAGRRLRFCDRPLGEGGQDLGSLIKLHRLREKSGCRIDLEELVRPLLLLLLHDARLALEAGDGIVADRDDLKLLGVPIEF